MTDPNKFWEEQKVKLAVKAERKRIIETIREYFTDKNFMYPKDVDELIKFIET